MYDLFPKLNVHFFTAALEISTLFQAQFADHEWNTRVIINNIYTLYKMLLSG